MGEGIKMGIVGMIANTSVQERGLTSSKGEMLYQSVKHKQMLTKSLCRRVYSEAGEAKRRCAGVVLGALLEGSPPSPPHILHFVDYIFHCFLDLS